MPEPQSNPDSYRMSIGEHLEDLRRRVIRCLIYLGAAFALCLTFNKYVMGAILRQPIQVLIDLGYENPELQFLSPTEGFITWLKLALVVAIFVASPFIFRELWGFVAAGLYPHERKPVRIYAPASLVLFLVGVVFLYFAVMPTALGFLLDFGTQPELFGLTSGSDKTAEETDPPAGGAEVEAPVDPPDVDPPEAEPAEAKPRRMIKTVPQVSKYLSLYITMSLIMGIVFQLPLVMMFLMYTGILAPETFSKYRRHFIVGAVAALAVLTPTGDAVTLLIVSGPVLLLYEVGLILGRMTVRRKEKRKAREEEESA